MTILEAYETNSGVFAWMVVRVMSRGTGASTRGFDYVKTIARPVDKFRRHLDLVDGCNTQ